MTNLCVMLARLFFLFFSFIRAIFPGDNPIPQDLAHNPHYLCYRNGIATVNRVRDIHEWRTITDNLRPHGWILKSSGTLNHSQDEWVAEVDADKLKKILMSACGAVIGVATAAGSLEIIVNIVNEAVECFSSALKRENNGKLTFTSAGKKEMAIRHSVIESPGHRYVAGYFLSFERVAAMKTNPLYAAKTEMVICNGSVDFFEILPDLVETSSTKSCPNLTSKSRPKGEPPKDDEVNQGYSPFKSCTVS